MFNISEVPDRRWVKVPFELAGDGDEVKHCLIEIQVLTKTPDELQEMKDAALDKIREMVESEKPFKPSESPHLSLTKDLIADWRGVRGNTDDGRPVELPFNDRNWKLVMSVPEAQKAIIKKVKEATRREDLIEGN